MYSIGISPCPNDTFIFDALLNNNNFRTKYQWDLQLADVEKLNELALQNKLDVTKLSFATYLLTQENYTLLDVGAALGNGVGPLLLTHPDKYIPDIDFESLSKILNQSKIAIPGKHTTANLLFSLAFPKAKNKTELPFNIIENKIKSGNYDYGLVIHESRFTYHNLGLKKVLDIGSWWEDKYHLPIPLGGIVCKKELGEEFKRTLEIDLLSSLELSWDKFPDLSSFIVTNAQEMDKDVMRQHIQLYVNQETKGLSYKAKEAIRLMAELYSEVKNDIIM